MYLNYDGHGSQFGETSVSGTTSNPDELSIFAAMRSDSALTVMVLNKTTSSASAPISVANFQAARKRAGLAVQLGRPYGHSASV